MTIARHYIMHAAEAQENALDKALRDLAAVVRGIPGCGGVELLRDMGNERRFIFIEKWESVDAHKAAGAHVPKETFSPVMNALDRPPEGSYLDYLPLP